MTGNADMMGLASYDLHREGISAGSYRLAHNLHSLFSYNEVMSYPPRQPLPSDFWLPDIQVFGARSETGTIQGLYLAGKGGNNAESHNHNDVGNFIIYMNGEPAIIDIGVETYRKETFSDKRYTIWTMQSQFHTLPTINGMMQKDGPDFKAKNITFDATPKQIRFSLELSDAYPEEAGINSWKRSFSFTRNKNITVREDYSLRFLKDSTFLNFMTPCEVRLVKKGEIELTGEKSSAPINLKLSYDPASLAFSSEMISITDPRLKNVWGDKLTRIKLTLINKKAKASLRYTIEPY